MENSFSPDGVKCLKAVDEVLNNVGDFKEGVQEIVEILLGMFECERAYLLYPCDPDALKWRAIECAVEECFGADNLGQDMYMDESIASVCRILREEKDVVTFGSKGQFPMPELLLDTFEIKSQLSMPIYTPDDGVLNFGLHQCSYERVWSDEEIALFREIGLHITKFIPEHFGEI